MLLQAATQAAGGQHFPTGALYVVATPIGNLADLTLRAIHVLSLVDAIACEDTRHSSTLLQYLGIERPLIALHQHNERDASELVLDRLSRGERVAYVSDAGTPAVSDPGAGLVAAAQGAGYRTLPIPGASSAVAALCVSGCMVDSGQCAGFVFHGFLSSRAAERDKQLQMLAMQPQAQVLFEAPHRIESLASALASAVGERSVTLCRELTKQFETVITMPAHQLPAWLAEDANRQRGEFVLVVHSRALIPDGQEVNDSVLSTLLTQLPLKQAVSLAVELTKAPRNELYARALLLKKNSDEA